MTNEKMDSLIRHNARWLRDIKIIIVDEIHLLNDPGRGITLEVVITKLRKIAPTAKILALSATIRNSDEIAEWLNADLVESDWRPVILKEGVFIRNKIVFADNSEYNYGDKFIDPLTTLSVETVRNNGQVLIFVNTRKSTVSLSNKLSKVITQALKENEKKILKKIAKKIETAREETTLGKKLASSISKGVAFHHAGLPYEYRRIIEKYFKENLIKVICATPTLSAGLNLPARRVIIRDHKRFDVSLGYTSIPVLEIKQMSGRAGRPKYDKIGEAILIAKDDDELSYLMETYILGEPEKIWSKLASEPALRSHILSAIATRFTSDYNSLTEFIMGTFYAHQYDSSLIMDIIQRVLDYLSEEEMIIYKENRFITTPFGKKISELYIDPKSAEIIRDALFLSSDKKLTELSFLHLICSTPDMQKLYLRKKDYSDIEFLAESSRDEFIVEVPDPWDNPVGYEFFLSELKTALLLREWINEEPEEKITSKFDVGPGDIQRLTELAEWLLQSTYEIAQLFKFNKILRILRILIKRVKHGVKGELLNIIKLKGVARIRGRILFNAGYNTLSKLKEASIEDIAKLPGFGPGLARKILEQINKEKITDKIIKGEKDMQKTLSEYEKSNKRQTDN